MVKVILSSSNIKKMLVNTFNGDIISFFNAELSKYILDGCKSINSINLKSYDSSAVPLTIEVCGTKLLIAFQDFVDIYDGKIIETQKIDFHHATAFYASSQHLVFSTDTDICQLHLVTFELTKCECQNHSTITSITRISNTVIAFGDAKGYLVIFDISDNKVLLKQKLHGDSIQGLSFQHLSFQHGYIYTVSRDKTIKRTNVEFGYDINIRERKASAKFGHFINCIHLNTYLYVGLSNGEIAILSSDLDVISSKKIHSDSIRKVCSVDKDKIITTADDGGCFVSCIKKNDSGIDIEICRKLASNNAFKIKCTCLAQHILYVGTSNSGIFSIDLKTNKRNKICETRNIRAIHSICDRGLIIGLESGELIYLTDITSVPNERQKLKRGATVYSIAYAEGNSILIIGRRDGVIEKYMYNKSKDRFDYVSQANIHQSIVGDIKIKNDFIYSCSDDQSVQLLDMDLNWTNTIRPSPYCTAINNLEFMQNSVVVSSDNGNIYAIDKDGKPKSYKASMYPIRALCYYINQYLIVGDRNGMVTLWNQNMQPQQLYQGNSRVVSIFSSDSRLYIVCEDAIIYLERSEVELSTKNLERSEVELSTKKSIFIIHGHNNELKRELQLLLDRAGVDGIVLHERTDRGRNIIDKLIEESSNSQFAIAILSPDDMTEKEIYHARQNVYLEIGYFLGKLGKGKVLIIKFGNVQIPSDLQGVLYIDIGTIEDSSWKTKVLNELYDAGYDINYKNVMKKL